MTYFGCEPDSRNLNASTAFTNKYYSTMQRPSTSIEFRTRQHSRQSSIHAKNISALNNSMMIE